MAEDYVFRKHAHKRRVGIPVSRLGLSEPRHVGGLSCVVSAPSRSGRTQRGACDDAQKFIKNLPRPRVMRPSP